MLPEASTCGSKISLGIYKSKEILQAKLNQAMQETEGFHTY